MKIAITGATGFLGSHLVNKLNKYENQISSSAFDRLYTLYGELSADIFELTDANLDLTMSLLAI